MPGRINEQDIQALRERADLAAVVGEHTSLKRRGPRAVGLCPFHSEKTPSFNVDAGKGFFQCFGCGAGGDVFEFLMKIEALAFPEAVERLASMVGFTLRYEELSPGQRQALGRKTRLRQLLAEAAVFFADQLAAPAGTAARTYLAGRGVTAEQIAHFRLGWAPDAWDPLTKHLLSAGFAPQELVDAGIATMGRQGPVDRFRGRVIFPISQGSDVVAFGGRVLPGVELATAPRDGAPPKYINSSETELYRKSETLYALNLARGEISRRDTALVVEGYLDVIGLHGVGVTWAVATCGTALTAGHFAQLERLAAKVVLALDADTAGYAAAEKARALAVAAGLRDVGVLPLPPGKDPADLAQQGREAVEAALAQTKTAVEFQIEQLLRTADSSTPEGQIDAYRRTFPLLEQLQDRFLRYTYIRDIVAPAVRLPADRIEQELDADLVGRAVGDGSSPPARAPAAERPVSAASALGDVAGAALPRDPQLRLERDVLQIALQRPDLLPDDWEDVTSEDFRAPASQSLFAALRGTGGQRLDAVLAALPDDDTRARVRTLALAESTVELQPSSVAQLVSDLRRRALRRRIDAARAQLAQVNEQVDPESRRALAAEHEELVRRLKGGVA